MRNAQEIDHFRVMRTNKCLRYSVSASIGHLGQPRLNFRECHVVLGFVKKKSVS